MLNPALETVAQDLSRVPFDDRGNAAVELVTTIDNIMKSKFPDLSDGMRGTAVLQLTHDVLARCIDIDKEALAARPGRLL